MDPYQRSTVTSSSFKIDKGSNIIPGLVSLSSDGKTAIFDQSSDLDTLTDYKVTITSGVKELPGNALASNKLWSFKIRPGETDLPTVEDTSPTDGNEDVPVGSVITAAPSEPVSSEVEQL